MPTQAISASVDIAVPVAKVYAYVADLPRHVRVESSASRHDAADGGTPAGREPVRD